MIRVLLLHQVEINHTDKSVSEGREKKESHLRNGKNCLTQETLEFLLMHTIPNTQYCKGNLPKIKK